MRGKGNERSHGFSMSVGLLALFVFAAVAYDPRSSVSLDLSPAGAPSPQPPALHDDRGAEPGATAQGPAESAIERPGARPSNRVRAQPLRSAPLSPLYRAGAGTCGGPAAPAEQPLAGPPGAHLAGPLFGPQVQPRSPRPPPASA